MNIQIVLTTSSNTVGAQHPAGGGHTSGELLVYNRVEQGEVFVEPEHPRDGLL
jgi:hypothetical protein